MCKPGTSSFNPHPPLLAGETGAFDKLVQQHLGVSIHTRHYWRVKQVLRDGIPFDRLFQSTPAITGG